jgi:shikimate dehydrogenase
MTTQASPAQALRDAVRACLATELGSGAAPWADLPDRDPRTVALTGLGTTATKALGSGLLATALAQQHLTPGGVVAHAAVDAALDDPGWDLGLVLSPFKPLVGAALADLSPSAAATGIVDTLVRLPAGVRGLNTNAWALAAAFTALLPGVRASRVLLLGSGGTARSTLLALVRHWPDAELHVSARREESIAPLAERFPVTWVPAADTPGVGASLVINSTTWGETAESEAAPFLFPADRLLAPGTVLFDLNNRRSALQEQALAAGCTVMSGTLMQRVTHACRAAAVRCVLDGFDPMPGGDR